MIYYITQYVETRGILKVDSDNELFVHVEVTEKGNLNFHGKFDFNRTRHYWHITKGNWFLKYSDALADAEKKKSMKIAKLKEQVVRLQSLTFPNSPSEL